MLLQWTTKMYLFHEWNNTFWVKMLFNFKLENCLCILMVVFIFLFLSTSSEEKQGREDIIDEEMSLIDGGDKGGETNISSDWNSE